LKPFRAQNRIPTDPFVARPQMPAGARVQKQGESVVYEVDTIENQN
jgi:hypothetical protein